MIKQLQFEVINIKTDSEHKYWVFQLLFQAFQNKLLPHTSKLVPHRLDPRDIEYEGMVNVHTCYISKVQIIFRIIKPSSGLKTNKHCTGEHILSGTSHLNNERHNYSDHSTNQKPMQVVDTTTRGKLTKSGRSFRLRNTPHICTRHTLRIISSIITHSKKDHNTYHTSSHGVVC